MYNVAVDVGGTFTDVLVFDESTGELTEGKVLTTPDDPSEGVVSGIESVCRKVGIGFTDLNLLFHGTTVVTNAILTNTGARVGLITTSGHEENLLLARAWTPGPLYGWMILEKPDPPADPTDTRGIGERIGADGAVIRNLNEDEVREAVSDLVGRGVEAITVSFMNSYLNPDHERRAREVVKEVAPEMAVSISSEIGQEYGEYERTLTTVVNTAVQPKTIVYMNGFEKSIKEKEFGGRLSIVRSDGGAMSTQAVAERPIQIALSGPSGGVTGSAYLARTIGVPDVLTFDMGGTSTDVSLCLGGEALVQRQIQIGYFQFKMPAADVHSVGAGGGSIAFLSSSGALQVGPMSAGAAPGPACYGLGGEAPTVTDANVVLHRLSPEAKLGGELELNEDAARRVVETVAGPLGMSVEEAAEAILEIVNENMHAALRVVSVERGHDPRGFGLVAFGGAGPMHASAMARLIGSKPVVIPPTPGVMSAFLAVPVEYMEKYYPLIVEEYRTRRDSCGAGQFRGGCGVKRVYRFLADGHITYQDDRAQTFPYGVDGGKPGGPSRKTLVRKNGDEKSMPSKVRDVPVFEGDRLVFETAGAGGLGDPLERLPEAVAKDVRWNLVSREAAKNEYGVVIGDDGGVDESATSSERENLRSSRPELLQFDRGDVPEREELSRRISDERRDFDEWLSAEMGVR